MASELLVVLDGSPGIGKHLVLACLGQLMPSARIRPDVNAKKILSGRGVLDLCKNCDYPSVQEAFLRARLGRDLRRKPRAGVTVQLRDVASCESFRPAAQLAARQHCPMCRRAQSPDYDPGRHRRQQKNAERQVRAKHPLARKMVVLIRSGVRRREAGVLRSHDHARHKSLKPAARLFSDMLDVCQSSRVDCGNNRIVMHHGDVMQTARAIKRVIDTERLVIGMSH